MLNLGVFLVFYLYNCYVIGGKKNLNILERLFRDILTLRDFEYCI